MTTEAFSRQPFCLLSCGRSGTTFLYRMLREHPRVAMTNEAKFLDFLVMADTFARIPAQVVHEPTGMQGMINAEYIPEFSRLYHLHVRRALEEFYESYFEGKDFTHWGDKTLTMAHAAGLARAFPEVKIVVQIRDPRDVMCSILDFTSRSAVKASMPTVGELSIRDHAGVWKKTYTDILAGVPDYHLVRYEDLITDPETGLHAVLDFLGLPPDAACLEPARDDRGFVTHATSRSPEESVSRWKKQLSPEDIEIIEGECGELMERFGY